MHCARYVLFCLALAGSLALAPLALAAQPPAAGKTVPDKPAAVVDRTTPVMVEHEGADTLGAKFAFQLKSLFNSSSLFSLTDKDEPKLKVLIATAEEFPSRPHIASVYSITWTFSQADGTLSFFLAHEVGVTTNEDLDAFVTKVASRADGMAAKYSYLFTKK